MIRWQKEGGSGHPEKKCPRKQKNVTVGAVGGGKKGEEGTKSGFKEREIRMHRWSN